MISGLPESAVVNQQLPKKAVYEKFGLTGQEKSRFDQSIHKMAIVAEVSPKTVNIAHGADVKSFFVIEVMLQSRRYDRKSIEMLFKLIEQNIVLILRHKDQCRLVVFKGMLIEGDWFDADLLSFDLRGIDLDVTWENLIKAVGKIEVSGETTLEDQIRIDAEQNKICLQIDILERKMRSEKQPRVKRELYSTIQNLKEKLI